MSKPNPKLLAHLDTKTQLARTRVTKWLLRHGWQQPRSMTDSEFALWLRSIIEPKARVPFDSDGRACAYIRQIARHMTKADVADLDMMQEIARKDGEQWRSRPRHRPRGPLCKSEPIANYQERHAGEWPIYVKR
jgi:hypothetical protein